MKTTDNFAPLANGSDGREFEFTPADFRRISGLIYERAGIVLSPVKSDMVYNRLSRRLRHHGLSSFAEYIGLLTQRDGAEWGAFIGALTTHLTSFFREEHHFPILSAHLAERREAETIHLWSCATSTGEEPYSMAVTAAETFGSLHPPVSILATDVDNGVLALAREGVYPVDSVRHLPERIQKRYFQWGSGRNKGFVKVRAELQSMITFQAFNLLAPVWPMKEQYDAIFCRNVMIYFDRPTQERILVRSRRQLKHDGLYFVGHSENLNHAEHLFHPCGRTVYRTRAVSPS